MPKVTQLIERDRDQIWIWLQSLGLNHSTAPPSCCHRPNHGGLAHEAKWLLPVGNEEPSMYQGVTLWQNSKKLGKVLGKWDGETDTRKLNESKQFEQLTASSE